MEESTKFPAKCDFPILGLCSIRSQKKSEKLLNI